MHFFWFVIAGICFVGYILLERRIAGAMHKSIGTQQPVRLPGKKINYIAWISIVSFVSVTALYLGFVTLYRAPVFSVCLFAGVIVAIVTAYVTSSRLKYVTFEADE